jgi:ATP-dependent DNA helicase RecG
MKERNTITQDRPEQEKKNPPNPLAQPLRFVKGVGPKRLLELERLGIHTVQDLLFHFPRRYEDRTLARKPAETADGEKGLVEGRVLRAKLIRTRRGPTIFRLELETNIGLAVGLWFRSDYLEETFKGVGRVALFGRWVRKPGEVQLIHPDYEIISADSDPKRIHTGRIVPFYACGGDLTPRVLRSIEYQLLLDVLPYIEDPLPPDTRRSQEIENRRFAFKSIHFPKTDEELKKAYRRLVFDEFFFIQLLLMSRKHKRVSKVSAKTPWNAALVEDFQKLLPFSFTDPQRTAIEAVSADLRAGAAMHRLLQGEVGSGKTTVAAFALYAAARSGRQGVLLAPTEILAQQHFITLSRIFAAAGHSVGLICRGISGVDRERTLQAAASGDLSILVGTHAVFQDEINFKDLAMVVVDEQHKFGVFQRKKLTDKSAAPHVLAMTATPIPQTLALTLYGDMDVTLMKGRPSGRGRVHTIWVGPAQREAVMAAARQAADEGRQVFVVHASVDSTGKGMRSAEEGFADLQKVLEPHRVALIHGRMSGEEKQRVMNDFAENRIQVLVATTVVEVGVDVPNASVLVIENAERFGLSQLHQLRGRIGRGRHESFCYLISDASDDTARERLEAFIETESGFEIAERDLRLRGPGDIWGNRQHGLPQLKIGDLARDGAILMKSREEAERWIREDPTLSRPEHQAAREELRARFPEHEL